MRIEDFVGARRANWEELEALLKRSRRGRLQRLSTNELERFGLLYRHAAADLAMARRDFAEAPVTRYLNALCARVHPILVRGEPVRLGDVTGFYTTTVPRLFRASLRYFLCSLALLITGALAGYLAVMLRPDLRASLIPQSLFDLLARGQIADIPNPVAGSWAIIFNNILVAFVCLVGGFLLGLPTAAAMAQNGWMLGTIAAAVHIGGYDARFWADIVPHGVVELSVIVIAGAAGLMIADSIVRPGNIRRNDAVPAATGRALRLTGGVATLLIICGLLEGFVSPSAVPAPAKFVIGVGYAALFYGWLSVAGRRRSRVKQRHQDGLVAL